MRVRNGAGREFGSLQHLGRRAERWRDTLVQRLADTEVSHLGLQHPFVNSLVSAF